MKGKSAPLFADVINEARSNLQRKQCSEETIKQPAVLAACRPICPVGISVVGSSTKLLG